MGSGEDGDPADGVPDRAFLVLGFGREALRKGNQK